MTHRKKILCLGIYLFFILMLILAIPIWTYFSQIHDQAFRVFIYVGAFGGLGGTIYIIRAFYKHVGEDNFKFSWIWWYIFRPLISIIIGVVVYLLIVGGLLSISSTSEIDYKKGTMLYCAISFLAGFSFTQFADKLEELASTLFTKRKSKL